MFYDASVVIIYRKEDQHFLTENLNGLPPGIEIVLCQNILSNENKLEIISESEDKATETKIIQAVLHYTLDKYSFSHFKNSAKSLASRKWIINLDSDERIHYIETEWQNLNNLNDNIGGIVVNVISMLDKKFYEPHGQTDVKRVVRIFRNHPNINYERRVHEDVQPSIEKLGLKHYFSTIDFKHIGYYTKDENIICNKYIRNINLLMLDWLEKKEDISLKQLGDTINEYNNIKKIKFV